MFLVSVATLIHRPRAHWVLVVVCVLACVGLGVLFVLREPEPAPVLVLKQPFSTPFLLRDQLGRWIPASASWNWARKTEDVLFGRRKPVKIYSEVFSFSQPVTKKAAELELGPPDFASDRRLTVWLLRDGDLKALHTRLNQITESESISRPRIITADGVGASVFVGESALINGRTNQVGLQAGFFARVQAARTDLFVSVQLTQFITNDLHTLAETSAVTSVQTNLDAAARLQVPKGSGVFLLGAAPTDSNRKRIGVIIDPP